MADAVLHKVIETIVKEQEYDGHKAEVKPISSGGANYTSQLFAVTLSAPNKKELNLFGKVAILGEQLRAMTTVSVFETELIFYTKILAKYRELEERHRIPEKDRIVAPKYYGGSLEYLKETLVLEDMTKHGYESFNRFTCFDWEYGSKCIASLAKLHAYSIAYRKDDPEEYAELIDKLKLEFPFDQMKDLQERAVVTCMEATEDRYKERVAKYFQKYMTNESFEAFYKPRSRPVLMHGDFRPSNVLHKKDKNGKLQVILVDYQVLQQGSPVNDILNFLIAGSDEEFKSKHLHQLFDHYYEQFSKTLRRLKIEPDYVYSKTEFDKNVKELLPYGLLIGAFALPFITVDEDKAPNLEDGIDLTDFAMEASDLFKTRFGGLVRNYVDMGMV